MSFAASISVQKFTQWISIVTASLAVFVGFFAFIGVDRLRVSDIQSEIVKRQFQQLEMEKALNEKRLFESNERAEELNSLIKKLESLPADVQSRTFIAGFDQRLNLLSDRIKKIEGIESIATNEQLTLLTNRFKKVEDVILQDPQKAVSMVIMSKDIENLKKSIEEKQVAQNASMDRLYTIVFGSIFVIALSVISQAVSAFFGPKRSDPKSQTS